MESTRIFERIYYETRDALLKFLIPRVRSSDDVEDLMQEIYSKLYRHLARRNVVREPLPYLYTIAKKELSRYYRRHAIRAEREEPLSDTLPDDAPSPELLSIDSEQTRAIWRLVKAEPLKSYQAFTLYYGFSVPTDEIAKSLGLSEDAVRRRISRTRERIRRQLSNNEGAKQ